MQAFSDERINLGQLAITNNIVQSELKRQRIRPEMSVKRDLMPYLLLVGALSSQLYKETFWLKFEVQACVLAFLLANIINSHLLYRNANNAYQSQLLKFKKLENEIYPLPRAFSLRLETSMIATPDEIADALLNPEKRKVWDLNVETINA